MNLNNRRSLDPRFFNAVNKPLEGFVNCSIVLYDMQLDHNGGEYNWLTNTGATTPPIELFSGPAQLQVYRFTLTMDAPVGSVDQVRSVRFTIDHADIAGVDIRKGQRIVVTECEHDESLLRYQFVVNSGLNSGSSFRRTIETEVDMARVVD